MWHDQIRGLETPSGSSVKNRVVESTGDMVRPIGFPGEKCGVVCITLLVVVAVVMERNGSCTWIM